MFGADESLRHWKMQKFEKRWEKDFSEMKVVKAEWLITRRCDLRCSYCGIRDRRTLMDSELPLSALEEIIEMFGELWPGAPMVVYGGEPTARPDLPDILSKGRECGVKLPVISNSHRVWRDVKYAAELVGAGLDNWSVSFDSLVRDQCVDDHSHRKSIAGFSSLIMFRDAFGLRDLVACVTVTRRNIEALPSILSTFTELGVHSIFTPLHIGGPAYQYARGNPTDLPTQAQVDRISEVMYNLVSSGRYLCSNDAGWFKVWPAHFLRQDWKCHDKGLVTIDADGSLKYCVDIPFRDEDRMYVWELQTEAGRQKFLDIIQKEPPCHGCLWNPAYESIKRVRDPEIGVGEGRHRARHYVDSDRLSLLHGGAGRYFVGNPDLNRVDPVISPEEIVSFLRLSMDVLTGGVACRE